MNNTTMEQTDMLRQVKRNEEVAVCHNRKPDQVQLSYTPCVVLTTGCEIAIDEPFGMQHLFDAISRETAKRVSRNTKPEEFLTKSIYELHFVAGQVIRNRGVAIDLRIFIHDFLAYWYQNVPDEVPAPRA